MIQGSLLMLWMKKHESTIKQKLLMMENLQLLDDSTTKLARTASTQGIDAGATGEVCCFGFYFYESKMDQN